MPDNRTGINIRRIAPGDDPAIAAIVTEVMLSYGADRRTTVLGDPKLQRMYANYQQPRSFYYIVELDGKIAGGCGIALLEGDKQNICELQRMFLLPSARGKGIGKILLKKCIAAAKELGFDKMYLESISSMKEALSLYESFGFQKIPIALGNTGHGGCNVFMIRDL